MLSVWIKACANAPLPSSPIAEQLASELAPTLWNINNQHHSARWELIIETKDRKKISPNILAFVVMNILCQPLNLCVIGFLFHYKVTTNGRVRTKDTRLVETGRQQRGCLILQAVKHSSAPEYRPNNCPKHIALTVIIKKPLFLHLISWP